MTHLIATLDVIGDLRLDGGTKWSQATVALVKT